MRTCAPKETKRVGSEKRNEMDLWERGSEKRRWHREREEQNKFTVWNKKRYFLAYILMRHAVSPGGPSARSFLERWQTVVARTRTPLSECEFTTVQYEWICCCYRCIDVAHISPTTHARSFFLARWGCSTMTGRCRDSRRFFFFFLSFVRNCRLELRDGWCIPIFSCSGALICIH